MREFSIKKSIDSGAVKQPVDSVAFSKKAITGFAEANKGKKVNTFDPKYRVPSDVKAAIKYVSPRLSSYKEIFEKALEEKRKKDPTADHLVEEEMDALTGGEARKYAELADIWKSYRNTTTMGEQDLATEQSQGVSKSTNYDPVGGGSIYMDVNVKPKLTYYSEKGTSTIKTPQQISEQKKKASLKKGG
jgi:hypothetical protein